MAHCHKGQERHRQAPWYRRLNMHEATSAVSPIPIIFLDLPCSATKPGPIDVLSNRHAVGSRRAREARSQEGVLQRENPHKGKGATSANFICYMP